MDGGLGDIPPDRDLFAGMPRSPRTHLPLLRTSMVKSYLGCPRRFYLEHVEGVVPVADVTALQIGTVWHRAMEVYLAAIRDGGATAEGLRAIDQAKLEPDDRARLRALYRGYCTRWEEQDRAGLVVVSIERSFDMDLVNPDTGARSRTWTFSGRLDGEVIQAGDALVLEHKTTSSEIGEGEDYWRARRIDSQSSNYLDATGASGVLYDVVQKPRQRRLLATPEEDRKYVKTTGALYASQRAEDETLVQFEERVLTAILSDPDRHYRRQPVVRIGDELEAARRDRWELARTIADAIRLHRFPTNADACFRIGATCPFVRLCSGEASIHDPTLFQKRSSGEDA